MTTKNYRNFLASGTLIGDKVYNTKKEHIGKIEELMIDLEKGKIGYAVMSLGVLSALVINILRSLGKL